MLHLVVPYRDRAAHLAEFLPYMEQYLEDVPHHFWIIEQSDDGRRFNRGALLNVGFFLAKQSKEDVFIFHDVDLLPDANLKPWYSATPRFALHHIAAVAGNRYVNSWGVGGILAVRAEEYERLNGHPNSYWGWGGEDDELRRRAERLEFAVLRPKKGSIRDLEEMTLEQKLAWLKERDLKNPSRKRAKIEHPVAWRWDGLATQSAPRMLERKEEGNVTFIKVEL